VGTKFIHSFAAWASKVSSSRFRRPLLQLRIWLSGGGSGGMDRRPWHAVAVFSRGSLAASLCQPENHGEKPTRSDDPTGGSSHKQGLPPSKDQGRAKPPQPEAQAIAWGGAQRKNICGFAGTAGILWRGSWLLRVKKKNFVSINSKNLILCSIGWKGALVRTLLLQKMGQEQISEKKLSKPPDNPISD